MSFLQFLVAWMIKRANFQRRICDLSLGDTKQSNTVEVTTSKT